MHAELNFVEGGASDEVGAHRVLLGKVRREVHLLPLVPLDYFLVTWKTKLTQVPTLDEVELASY